MIIINRQQQKRKAIAETLCAQVSYFATRAAPKSAINDISIIPIISSADVHIVYMYDLIDFDSMPLATFSH